MLHAEIVPIDHFYFYLRREKFFPAQGEFFPRAGKDYLLGRLLSLNSETFLHF